MNTQQMVIAWYAVLLVSGLSAYRAIVSSSSATVLALGTLSVALVTALALYAAGEKPQADGRTVLIAVAGPLGLAGMLLAGIYAVPSITGWLLGPDKPEVAVMDGVFAEMDCRDPLLHECSGTCFKARVENQSQRAVGEVRLNFTLVDGRDSTRDKWVHTFALTDQLERGEVERLDYCVHRPFEPDHDQLFYGVESASWAE